MPRADKGRPHKYNLKRETRGNAGKENSAQRAFWTKHTMDQMLQVAGKELDAVIDKWLADYEERQLKRNKHWWYPTLTTTTLNDVVNKRTKGVDKGWHL